MVKIIHGGKTTPMYREDNNIGFRGKLYDYILVIFTTLFVIGFFILQSS